MLKDTFITNVRKNEAASSQKVVIQYEVESVFPYRKFKFRWKRGYKGPTAETCNKNYKTMPKDF